MQILRAERHKRMPWKNGGGETTEIAVFPEIAGINDFDWRVSMARVDGDGPFSGFPGIDRTLAIIEGAGIVLDVAGQAPTRLTSDSDPHAFPADVASSATLIDAAVIDLNVMSRRGRVEHSVKRLHQAFATPAGADRLIFCSMGSALLASGGRTETLGPRDAALLGKTEALTLTPSPDGEIFLVEFGFV